MTVTTAGFLGITEDELRALIASGALAEEWTLSRAALAAKAERQKRDRKGRWRDQGIVSGVGRKAKGWLDRDIANLRADIANTDNPPTVAEYRTIGAGVDKVAKRFSQRHVMEARMKVVDDRRAVLFDKGYKLGELDGWKNRDFMEVHDYLSPEERAEDIRLRDEYFATGRKLLDADVHAYLGVLRELRPMGGDIKIREVKVQPEDFAHDELPGLLDALVESLDEVSEVLPSAWVDRMNERGTVDYTLSTERAQHSIIEEIDPGADPQAAEVHQMLDSGYRFEGYAQVTGQVADVRGGGKYTGGLRDLDERVPVLVSEYSGARIVVTSWGQIPGGVVTKNGSWPVNLDDLAIEPGEPPPSPVVAENSLIRVNPAERGTLLHELGHRVEKLVGEDVSVTNNQKTLLNALLRFTGERRHGGEGYKPLAELTGNLAYEDHERSFDDKWINPYIGKYYAGRASEVLTMGLQMLFYPTQRQDLARDDDMRHFILGLLAAA